MSIKPTTRNPWGETGVVGQRSAEIAEAHDDHRPVVSGADDAADLKPQVLHVVADPAGAVGAQVRQVLAELSRVHARRLSEGTAADGVDLLLGQLVECSKVDRQPGDGRVRDSLERGDCSPMLTAAARGGGSGGKVCDTQLLNRRSIQSKQSL